MNEPGRNYLTTSIGALKDVKRETLHDALALTGTEISLNQLAAGTSSPFLQIHKQNEEVYVVLRGRGAFQVDGEEFDIEEGTAIRVDPAGKRSIKAAEDEGLIYLCIQAGCGTLTQFTRTDGVLHEERPAWR
jgi:mannose-6-phosphate isomerase-like protein (cupin superfamily)